VYRRKGVDNGILDLRGTLGGCFLDVGVRLGWGSGAGMKWGRWIEVVTLVGWGEMGNGFALRWHLSLVIRAKRGYDQRAKGELRAARVATKGERLKARVWDVEEKEAQDSQSRGLLL
jgi:hypothetical protein